MEKGELPALIFPYHENLPFKVILTPRNNQSLKVNDVVLDRHQGEAHVYYMADVAQCPDDPDEAINYNQDLLHSMTPTGLPPHKLTIKVGCIVMLLHNLKPAWEICNRTSLHVVHSVCAEILTGDEKATAVLIPHSN